MLLRFTLHNEAYIYDSVLPLLSYYLSFRTRHGFPNIALINAFFFAKMQIIEHRVFTTMTLHSMHGGSLATPDNKSFQEGEISILVGTYGALALS